MKLPEGSRRTRFFQNKFASFGKPPEVKLSEGRKQVRFLRKAARGEASRRKPKDALFSKEVQKAARGEASRRTFASFGKPPEVKLPEGRSESRRTRFFQNKFASFGFLRKAATPPEVKLPEGSRRTRFFQNKFSKPKVAEGSRASFRKPKEAEGRASSRRKGRSPLSEGRPF